MKRQRWYWALPVAGIVALFGVVPTNPAAEPPKAEWKLVWSDEFDGKEIDKAKWDFDLGNGFYNNDGKAWVSGWGNDEIAVLHATSRRTLRQGWHAAHPAMKESYERLRLYVGRDQDAETRRQPVIQQEIWQIRVSGKLPTGKGVWPALWMLPQDEKYGGWAASGEIDVLEARGQEPTKVLGTLHFGWLAGEHARREGLRPAATGEPSRTFMSTRWNGNRVRSGGTWTASSIQPNRSGGAAASRTAARG